MTSNLVCLREKEFLIKTIESKTEKDQLFRLRYEIFCEELGWISDKNDGMETDVYDDYAISLGVFDIHECLIGAVRIIFSYLPMMIEKEFLELVSPSHRIRKDLQTAEITRLGIKKCARRDSKRLAVLALYKGLYIFSKLNNITRLYLVVEKKIYRALIISGFPLQTIGPIKRLEGGVESLAATMDWQEFEKGSKLLSYFLQGYDFKFECLRNRVAAG